ncbi:MAG: exonuclease SbcCD subunit D [Gemmataceae bacterium]|nr:exonuclease SbcCD subunit D [Gemmataceae bacterium]
MRIVHTADWHLGDRLGRIDRTFDLRQRVEQVADICEKEQADVLLVAGDLFSELARPDGLRDAIGHLQQTFASFLARGGTILAITGNHDNESFCQTLWHAMSLAAPAQSAARQRAATGRLHLATEPTWLRLPDPSGTFDVAFVLMPYPTPAQYLNTANRFETFVEKNQMLSESFSRRLAELFAEARDVNTGPTILVAHITVRADYEYQLFRMNPGDDVSISANEVPPGLAYAALGHIHKPGGVAEHIRYSGSIDRLDLGEQADAKSVLILDVTDRGLVSVPRQEMLDATPIYEVLITDPAEDLASLRRRFPDARRDLVKLSIRYRSGRDSLEEVLRRLEEIFPRWYSREWVDVAQLGPSLNAEAAVAKSFRETVLEYLDRELSQHTPAEKEAILARAERLIADLEQGRPTP